MQEITKETILSSLKQVKNPLSHQSIVDGSYLKTVSVCDNIAKIAVELSPHERGIQTSLDYQIRGALASLGLKDYKIEFQVAEGPRPETVAQKVESLIKNVVAVASGKGGVGKSTVAANMAV